MHKDKGLSGSLPTLKPTASSSNRKNSYNDPTRSILTYINPLELNCINTSLQRVQSGPRKNSSGYANSRKLGDESGSGIGFQFDDENEDIIYDVSNMGVPAVPDGGYGWVIVFSSFMCNLIVDGIANSFGVFIHHYVGDFGKGEGQVAWAGSLLCGIYLCVGPIVSALTNKFGCRVVCIAGSIVAATGFALSSLSPTLEILILTYGVIGGIGFGLIYLPAVVCVGYYFESKRAFATGIAVCGSGVGTIVFPPFASFLLDRMTWNKAHLIYAGIIISCGFFGLLMKPLEIQVERTDDDDQDQISKKNSIAQIMDEDNSTKPESAYFTVQLPNGKMERRLKIPLNVDPGDHSNLNSDQLVPGTHLPSTLTNTEAKPTDTGSQISQIDSKNVGGNIPRNDSTPQFKSTKSRIIKIGSEALLRKISVRAVPLGTSNRSSKLNLQEERKSFFKNSMLSFGSLKSKINGGKKDDYNSMLSNEELISSSKKDQATEPRHIVRPMSRKDIFYSGSIAKLPEFQSQKSIHTYRQSILNVPRTESTAGHLDLDAELPPIKHKNKCCSCFGSGHGAFINALEEMMDFSLIKNPIFLLIALSNVFGFLGYYVPIVFIVRFAEKKELAQKHEAFLLISVIGVTNTIGRVLTGIISDMPRVNSLLMNNMCILLSGICVLMVPFFQNVYAFIGVAIAFGFFVSGYISLTSIILVDLLGLDNLTNAFGLLILFRGGASIAGTPLAGAIYDTFQNYDIPFFLAGGLFLISSFISFLVPFVTKFAPPKITLHPQIEQDDYIEDIPETTEAESFNSGDLNKEDETIVQLETSL